MTGLYVPDSVKDAQEEATYHRQGFRAWSRPDGLRMSMQAPMAELAEKWLEEADEAYENADEIPNVSARVRYVLMWSERAKAMATVMG